MEENKESHISLFLCKRKDEENEPKTPKLHGVFKIADHFGYIVAIK